MNIARGKTRLMKNERCKNAANEEKTKNRPRDGWNPPPNNRTRPIQLTTGTPRGKKRRKKM